MKKNRNYLFFITPGFVVYTIFAIIPILYVVYLAFTNYTGMGKACLLYTSPSPRDISGSRMPSSA